MIKDKKRKCVGKFPKGKKLDKIMAPRHNILHCFVQQKEACTWWCKVDIFTEIKANFYQKSEIFPSKS